MTDWFLVFGLGAAAVVLMTLIESFMASRQRRRPQGGAVLLCGLVGMAYFVGMLIASGQL